jgi:probable rRNA maturation factor
MITISIEQSILDEGDQISPDVLEQVQELVNSCVMKAPDGNIDVRFVSDSEIKRLNRMYRNKDEITDVLSFQYPDNKELLGDVAISFAQAQRQVVERPATEEAIELIVHGVLHILGYDHERPGDDKVMFSLQDSIIEQIL